MKTCSTCRWERKDLECFIHHCAHPSLLTVDAVNGEMMRPIRKAVKACQLSLWERPRSFTDWIFGKRKDPAATRPDWIITSYETPPIPVPGFWRAYDDRLGADCSPYGQGATEDEAVEDLMAQLEERE